jgi:hypothetical protein
MIKISKTKRNIKQWSNKREQSAMLNNEKIKNTLNGTNISKQHK